MKLVIDAERFDDLQPWFVGDIIDGVKRRLEQDGVHGERLKDLCGDIAFSMCALLDSSQSFEVDGKEYASFLAFSDSDDSMFYPGGNSYLHEYVFGVLDEIFEES